MAGEYIVGRNPAISCAKPQFVTVPVHQEVVMKTRRFLVIMTLIGITLACAFPEYDENASFPYSKVESVAVNPPSGTGSFTLEVTYKAFSDIGRIFDTEPVTCYYVTPDGATMPIGTIDPPSGSYGGLTQIGTLTLSVSGPGVYTATCEDDSSTSKASTGFSVIEPTPTPTATPTSTPTPTFTPTLLYTPTSTPLPAKWYIRVYNVDDLGTAYVNGSKITEIQFAQDSGWIDVTAYFSAPTNSVRFTMWNGEKGYAWGFAIERDGVVVWSDVQGEVNVMGANNNDKGRMNMTVYDLTIVVNQSGEVTIEP
jgi:hypothetical protein